MPAMNETSLVRLVRTRLGERDAQLTLAVLKIDPMLAGEANERVSRAVVAMALNVALFHDLTQRASTGGGYVNERRATGRTVVFDHGALRTIRFGDGPTGALPAGEAAFRRILEPLGYHVPDIYPLDRLKMTGRAYTHLDFPEAIPQFFVSELHVDRFSPDFQMSAKRVFGNSSDPLGEDGRALLDVLARQGSANFNLVASGLIDLVAAFSRRHATPELADYERLAQESQEAAWIATEGNAFNHATDRVEDVETLAEELRAKGRPIKDTVEVSASGRVRQTAFRADPVEREFTVGADVVRRKVPGSFYEFITRARCEDGKLDLRFDSGNAQGIFKMTEAAGV